MNHPTREHPIVATSSRIVYENPWLKIREDTTLRLDGSDGLYGVVETNDSVVVAAVSDKNEIYIVWGYSYPADTWSWQIPGGGGDNEAPESAAARELKEETGLEASTYRVLGNLIVTCGLLKERMAVVLATGIVKGKRLMADDIDSISDGKFVAMDQIEEMIDTGAICDSQSISAIHLARRAIERT